MHAATCVTSATGASRVGVCVASCLKAAQESLDTRREMAGHPRGYLDFLAEFIPEARRDA